MRLEALLVKSISTKKATTERSNNSEASPHGSAGIRLKTRKSKLYNAGVHGGGNNIVAAAICHVSACDCLVFSTAEYIGGHLFC